jgi:hypothetical protein
MRICLVLLFCVACAKRDEPGSDRAPERPADLPLERDVPSVEPAKLPDDDLVIAPGTVDAIDVRVDGVSTWPPEGAGCTALVRCCDAIRHLPAMELTCRLSVASDRSCASALETVRNVLRESGHEAPAACTS